MTFGGCCCFVLPLGSIAMGWAAYTRGRDELRDIDNGYIGADTRGLATVGMILGLVSLGIGTLSFVASAALFVLNLLGAGRSPSYY